MLSQKKEEVKEKKKADKKSFFDKKDKSKSCKKSK